MSVVMWVVVDSFVNLEPEIFFGSLLPEVAVVGIRTAKSRCSIYSNHIFNMAGPLR